MSASRPCPRASNPAVPGTRRATAGGADARVALVLLAAAVLAVLGWILLQGEDGEANVADVGGALAPPGAEETALAVTGDEGSRTSTGPAALSLGPGGMRIPAGVRLAGPGRLEGVVLDRASAAAVPGARVDLLSMPPAGREFLRRIYGAAKFESSWIDRLKPIATAGTDDGGRFAFEGVRRGTYFLEARAAWSVPDTVRLVRVDEAGSGGPVEVFTRRGGRVLGTVVRPDGSPVRDATVEIFPGLTSFLTAARSGDFRMISAPTDAEGRFTLVGVPPGKAYDLVAHGPTTPVTHVFGVEVVAGQDTEVELEVHAGGTVRGRVMAALITASGEERLEPVAGAHVGALARGMADLEFSEEVLGATHAVTGADGSYVMRHVPPGEIDVGVVAEGLVPGKSAPVRVIDGAETRAEDVVLLSGPSVRLRFVDEEGAPIPDVRASWFVVDFDELEFDLTFTPFMLQAVEGFDYPNSDADGMLLAGPFPGADPYSIFCWKSGYGFTVVEWEPERDGDEVEVELVRGGAVEGIVMDLDRGEPVRRFQIKSPYRLDWQEAEPSVLNPFSGGLWVEDPNGRFRLDQVTSGGAELTFTAPGYLPETVEVAVGPGETAKGLIVNLRSGGTIRGTITDRNGEPVAGAQVAALDERGRPIEPHMKTPRADVRTMKGRVGQEFALGSMELFASLGVLAPGFATSGPDGSYELSGLPEGEAMVHASHRDFAEGKTGPVQVRAEPVEGVDLVLGEGGGVFGQVTDRFGQPVPGALVLAFSTTLMASTDPSARWVHQGGTDASGDYRIEHMEPGGYFLACTRGDKELNLISFFGTLNFDLVTVPEDEMVEFDIIDSSASAVRVHGRITSEGEPVRGGGIFALGFESENVLGIDVKIARVDAAGNYEFEGLAPGEYQFTYQEEGPEVRLDVEIPDVPDHRLDLALPEGSVAGRVVDAVTGEPVPSCELVLRRDEEMPAGGMLGAMIQREGRAARDWTGKKGDFRFRRLQEGSYQLTLTPPRWGDLAGTYAPPESLELEVVEGVPQGNLEIALTPSLEIRGVVLSAETGGPLDRARVWAAPRGATDVRPSRTRSGEDGSFTLRSLAPGTYLVRASARDYADAPPVEAVVTPGEDPGVEIVLHRGVDVVVHVQGPDGLPLQGATGRLVGEGDSATLDPAGLERTIEGLFTGKGVSGPDGILELGRYAPGRYRLEVQRGTLAGSRDGVDLREGPPLELDLRLE